MEIGDLNPVTLKQCVDFPQADSKEPGSPVST